MKRCLPFVFALCLLASCGPSPIDTLVPSTPTPTEPVLLEILCEPAHFKVKAWLDENRNGIWDTGERPMAGVRFHLEIIARRGYRMKAKARSDPEGFAWLEAIGDGFDKCRIDVEIYAEVPDGYEPTTPVRQGEEGGSWSQPTLYGFAPLLVIAHTSTPE